MFRLSSRIKSQEMSRVLEDERERLTNQFGLPSTDAMLGSKSQQKESDFVNFLQKKQEFLSLNN